MLRTIAIALGAMHVLAATPAGAAKLCVDPAKPTKCSATIQAAVDLASAGDVITVAPLKDDAKGYRENVTVIANDLTIRGKGRAKGSLQREGCPKTVLDGCETAEDPTACSADVEGGAAFVIEGTGVTVEGFIIRHFYRPIRFLDGADDVTIRSICFIDNDEGVFNVDLDSSNASRADRLTVERSLFRGNQSKNVEIAGTDTLVRRNLFFGADDGLKLWGDGIRVEENEFTACNNRCVEVRGANATITENVIDTADDAIEAFGNNHTITKNEVSRVDDNNINVACGADPNDPDPATCTGGLIAENEVRGNSDDDKGIRASGDNLMIRENLVTTTADQGIRYDGDDGSIVANEVQRAGVQNDEAIIVTGNDNTITDNEILLAGDVGIENNGDRNVYRRNEVKQSARAGIFIRSGDANVVEDNELEDNHGEGIANSLDATNTEIDDNTAEDNRTDICNDGTVASFTGNTFDTGGDLTPCVLNRVLP